MSEQCVSTKVNAVSLQSPCFYNCNVNFVVKKDTSSQWTNEALNCGNDHLCVNVWNKNNLQTWIWYVCMAVCHSDFMIKKCGNKLCFV